MTHREGARYIFVAFLGVYFFLSAILSSERFINGVFEQGLFINQPEEVRVVLEGFGFR